MDKDKIALDFIKVYKRYKDRRVRYTKVAGREAGTLNENHRRSERQPGKNPDQKS